MLNILKKNSILILFITSILAMMSNSWFQLWILLEVNMMAFIPFMYNTNTSSINAMLKYFFIQAMASSIFMLSIILSTYLYQLNNDFLILLSMMTKLGMFPLFMWFPQISKMISWNANILLMSIQKFIPLFTSMSLNSDMMKFIIIMSAMISSLGMWNQNSLQVIMAYSSMNHMSWMMISISMKMFLWMIYLLIYSIIMYILLNMFKIFNMNSIHQLSYCSSNKNSIIMIFNMWSLGGLPPLLGFLPKWLMIMNIQYLMIDIYMITIISSLINIFTYTRLLFPLMMKYQPNLIMYNKWNIINIMIMIPMMILMFI